MRSRPRRRVTAAEIAKATRMTEGGDRRRPPRHGEAWGASFQPRQECRTIHDSGPTSISRGPHAYDEYLRYQTLGELLERPLPQVAALDWPPRSPTPNSITTSSGTKPTAANAALLEERPQPLRFVIMAMDPENPELLDTYRTIQNVCLGIRAPRLSALMTSSTAKTLTGASSR